MSDIHALSGAYAVDALDDIERIRFERHLAECPECRAEVDSLREAAALLPATTALAPPPGLRDRVLADIAAVRPLPPLTVAAPRRRFRPATLVAAAAAVVALAGGALAWQPWEDPSSQGPQQEPSVDEVLRAADAEVYVEEFPDGSTATLTRSPSLNKAVVETSDMALPPEGKVYELWLDHDGVLVPAGLMPREPDAVVVLDGDPATAQGMGITIEPEGGSEEPTSEPVAVIPFEKA